MKYLTSAFSLQMIPEGATLEITPVGLSEIRKLARPVYAPRVPGAGRLYTVNAEGEREEVADVLGYVFHSDVVVAIGHPGTVAALCRDLCLTDTALSVERRSITLEEGDTLYVAQPTGKRLECGAEIDLPELAFFRVEWHTCYVPKPRPALEDADAPTLAWELEGRLGVNYEHPLSAMLRTMIPALEDIADQG